MVNEIDDVIPINIGIVEYEDFTLWCLEPDIGEYPPCATGTYVTIGPQSIVGTMMPVQGYFHVKKDAGLFGDFEHQTQFRIDAIDPGAMVVLWGVYSDPTIRSHGMANTVYDGISIYTAHRGEPRNDYLLYIKNHASGSGEDYHSWSSSDGFDPFQTYYLKIIRNGTNVSCHVYTNQERTIHAQRTNGDPVILERDIDNSTAQYPSGQGAEPSSIGIDRPYQYIHAMMGRAKSGIETVTYEINNLARISETPK